MQLYKKQQLFPEYFLHIWSLHETLTILKKKITLIGYAFSKLEPAKDTVS